MSDVLVVCPACSTESEHEVIRRTSKGNGEDILARCMDCSHVHTLHLRPPRMVRVRATLSDGNASASADIEVDDDEVISVGDIFEHDGITWRVTRIDNSESRLVNSLVATRIHSIWAIRCDKVVVGITMNYGDVSESTKIECDPDRVFSFGSIFLDNATSCFKLVAEDADSGNLFELTGEEASVFTMVPVSTASFLIE